MWPGPFPSTAGSSWPTSPTASAYGNVPRPPQPPLPDPGESQLVDRRLGLSCRCPLLECCHNEDTDLGDRFRVTPGTCCASGFHVHSGSPASGYVQPWEPGDESWRNDAGLLARPRRE